MVKYVSGKFSEDYIQTLGLFPQNKETKIKIKCAKNNSKISLFFSPPLNAQA